MRTYHLSHNVDGFTANFYKNHGDKIATELLDGKAIKFDVSHKGNGEFSIYPYTTETELANNQFPYTIRIVKTFDNDGSVKFKPVYSKGLEKRYGEVIAELIVHQFMRVAIGRFIYNW